jgi:hypothetical protein
MDARAALNVASEAAAQSNGEGTTLTQDPLRRFEAEVKATGQETGSTDPAQPVSAHAEQPTTDGEQPDGAQLYEEAQGLLEEAWGIFTECQVMRDGLLAACEEIERTMESIQLRLDAVPIAMPSNGNGNGNGHLANGSVPVTAGSAHH